MRLPSLLLTIAFLALTGDRPGRGNPPPSPGARVASLGIVPFWTDGSVTAVAFSPDGKLLASGSHYGKLFLWDVATGKEIRRILTKNGGPVMSVAFSPDGRTLAYRGDVHDDSIYLLDATTGKELFRFGRAPVDQIAALPNFPTWAFTVAFSPDGRLLASGAGGVEDGDHLVHLWDVATGKEVRQLDGHHQCVTGFAFSPDGKTLVSGSRDRTVRLWEVASGKELRRIGNPASGVVAVAFAPNGRTIAVACRDRTVRLCSTATGKELARFSGTTDIRSVAFAPDGKTLAWGEWQSIRLWALDTGKECRRLQGNQSHVVSLVFSPDGKLLASVGEGQDRYVHVCEPATGKRLSAVLEGFGGILSMSYSPGGRLATTGHDGIVRLWDVAAGAELWRGDLDKPSGDRQLVVLSPDGKVLASSGPPGGLRLREAATGKELRRLPVTAHVGCLGFSPDGKLLAAGLSSGDVLVWNAATGEEVLQLGGHRGFPRALSFSSDGKLLATADEFHIRVWDTATGKRLRRLGEPNTTINTIAFAPGSRLLACNYSQLNVAAHVCFWDAASGTKLWALDESALLPAESRGRGAGVGNQLVFSADGRMVATPGRTQPLLWEVISGKLRCRLGERPGTGPMAFAPDDCVLAVAGGDNVIQLLDVAGRDRRQQTGRPAFNAAERQRLWAALADSDATAAYEAMLSLTASPAQAVSLFKERLRPIVKVDESTLARLIADLNDKRFPVREKARVELGRLEETAVPAIRRALADPPTLEVRRRLEKLLEEVLSLQVSGERLRGLRAMEVLERSGTVAARQFLQTLAEGAAEARLTREARSALRRLRNQSTSEP